MRIYSTTYPGAEGHARYRARFVVPHQQQKETENPFHSCEGDRQPIHHRQISHHAGAVDRLEKARLAYGDSDIAVDLDEDGNGGDDTALK